MQVNPHSSGVSRMWCQSWPRWSSIKVWHFLLLLLVSQGHPISPVLISFSLPFLSKMKVFSSVSMSSIVSEQFLNVFPKWGLHFKNDVHLASKECPFETRTSIPPKRSPFIFQVHFTPKNIHKTNPFLCAK